MTLNEGSNYQRLIDAGWTPPAGKKECQHEWGTDGAHSNEFCKKCFIDKPQSSPSDADVGGVVEKKKCKRTDCHKNVGEWDECKSCRYKSSPHPDALAIVADCLRRWFFESRAARGVIPIEDVVTKQGQVLLARLRDAGFVQLDPDQTLPDAVWEYWLVNAGCRQRNAFIKLLQEAGFKRVVKE